MMIARRALALTCLLLLPPSLGGLGCGGDDDDVTSDDETDDATDPMDDDASDETDDPSGEGDTSDDSSGDGDGDDDGEPACGAVLDDSLRSAEDAVASAGAVYFLDDGGLGDELRVLRIDRATGEVEVLATLDVGKAVLVNPQLAVDEAHVYIATEIGLWRVPVAGGEPDLVTADEIGDLAMDETHVYWFTSYPVGGDFDRQLRRAPKAGGEPEILFDVPPGSTAVGIDAAIAVDDANLYWHDAVGDLRRMPKEGGEPGYLADLVGLRAPTRDMVVVDGDFYWYGKEVLGGDNVYDYFHLEVDGTDRLIARVTGGFVSDRLVIEGGDLYFAHLDAKDTDGLYRVSLEGGDPDRLLPALSRAFMPTEEGLYVASSFGLELVPREGCER